MPQAPGLLLGSSLGASGALVPSPSLHPHAEMNAHVEAVKGDNLNLIMAMYG